MQLFERKQQEWQQLDRFTAAIGGRRLIGITRCAAGIGGRKLGGGRECENAAATTVPCVELFVWDLRSKKIPDSNVFYV